MGASAVELRHLRAFAAIAAEGSITAAARRLSVTQPALSRTLRQLESHLGVQLVERTTTSLRLSAQGAALLPDVIAALAAVAEALDPERLRRRPLRLGHSWSAAGERTTAVVRAWAAAHPDVPLEVRRTDDRWGGLTRGLADVAVLRGRRDVPGLRTAPLPDEPRIAVLPAGHELSGAEELSMADLVPYPLVANTVSGTVSPALWPPGARPSTLVRVGTLEDWLIAVAAGRGVSVTPASTPALHTAPGVVFVPLRDAPPVPVVLAWRDGPGHPARADFVAVARAAAYA